MAKTVRDKAAGSAPARSAASAERFSRWTLLTIWTVLTVWSVCLWVMSGRALGFCWAGMVQAGAAELLALALALSLPDFFVRSIFALGMRFRPGKALAMQVLLTARGASAWRGSSGAGLGVLAVASAGLAAGGLVSSFAVEFAADAMRWLGSVFLFPMWTWALVRVSVAVVLMLPIAVPTAAVIQIASLLGRRGAGEPADWLTRRLGSAVAAGLVLASGIWWAGVNLQAVALGCAAVLVVAAAGAAAWGRLPLRASAGAPSAARPARLRGMSLLAWAMLGFVVTLQCRALRDAVSADWALSWLWGAYTAGLLAMAWARVGATGGGSRAADSAAAGCGAVLIAAMQMGFLILAAADAVSGWIWAAMTAAGQIPFAMLSAQSLAWCGESAAGGGISLRSQLKLAAGAVAVGAYLAIGVLACPESGRTLALAALMCLTVMFLVGIRVARSRDGGAYLRPQRQLKWAGAAVASIVAVALVFAGAARAGRAAFGRHLSIGSSLTAYQTPTGEVEVLNRLPAVAKDDRLTDLARRIIRSRPGRWWVVPGNRPKLLVGLPERVRVSPYFPEGAMGLLPAYRGVGERYDFARCLNTQTQLQDGIYLGGLRADHADSWCLYNEDVVNRCLDQLAPEGVMVLHARAHQGGLDRIVAVVKTFSAAAGQAQAAVAIAPDAVEVLLVADSAQDQATALVEAGEEVTVLPAADLVDALAAGRTRAVSVLTPRRRCRVKMTLSDLAVWLQRRSQ